MPVVIPAISRPESTIAQTLSFPSRSAAADFSDLLHALPCLAFLEQRGLIVAQNSLASAATGSPRHLTLSVDELFLGTHPFTALDAAHLSQNETPQIFDCMLLRGNRRPIAIHGAAGPLPGERDLRLILALEGPAGHPHAAQRGSFLGDLLDAAPEAMAITADGRVLHVNREFSRLFGYPAELCEGQEIDALLAPAASSREMETILHLIASSGSASLETVRHIHNGDSIDVSILVGPVPLDTGPGLFYTFRDIRPQKEAQALLHYRAMHDALTELPNRACFLDRLRAALASLRRIPERSFALMFLDLDGFKSANDRLGHRAGDALLCEIADRLRACVRPQDTVARLGGDEFALIIDDAGTTDDITAVALRIQTAIRLPVELEAGNASVSASVGIKLVDAPHASPEEVLHHADLAMYHAKAHGKARHEIYHGSMDLPGLLRKAS